MNHLRILLEGAVHPHFWLCPSEAGKDVSQGRVVYHFEEDV